MKAPDSLFNTHILTVKGLVSVDDGSRLLPIKDKVDIRCTSDVNGETLSLTVKNVQIAVKVKDVEKIIQEARKSRSDIA